MYEPSDDSADATNQSVPPTRLSKKTSSFHVSFTTPERKELMAIDDGDYDDDALEDRQRQITRNNHLN